MISTAVLVGGVLVLITLITVILTALTHLLGAWASLVAGGVFLLITVVDHYRYAYKKYKAIEEEEDEL